MVFAIMVAFEVLGELLGLFGVIFVSFRHHSIFVSKLPAFLLRASLVEIDIAVFFIFGCAVVRSDLLGA